MKKYRKTNIKYQNNTEYLNTGTNRLTRCGELNIVRFPGFKNPMFDGSSEGGF
jgi:hypothetical protein